MERNPWGRNPTHCCSPQHSHPLGGPPPPTRAPACADTKPIPLNPIQPLPAPLPRLSGKALRCPFDGHERQPGSAAGVRVIPRWGRKAPSPATLMGCRLHARVASTGEDHEGHTKVHTCSNPITPPPSLCFPPSLQRPCTCPAPRRGCGKTALSVLLGWGVSTCSWYLCTTSRCGTNVPGTGRHPSPQQH